MMMCVFCVQTTICCYLLVLHSRDDERAGKVLPADAGSDQNRRIESDSRADAGHGEIGQLRTGRHGR